MENELNQSIKNGSDNICLGALTINNGLSINDVIKVLYEVIIPNVNETVDNRVQEHLKDIILNIESQGIKDFSSFQRPDCMNKLKSILYYQACYNDKSKNKIFSDLLSQKMTSNWNEDKQFNVMIDKSIDLMNNLSIKHIDFLSIICISKNIKLSFSGNYTSESFCSILNDFARDFKCDDINGNDIAYLFSIGCLTLSIIDSVSQLAEMYNLDKATLNNMLLPVFKKVPPDYHLTPISIPIAIANINLKKNFRYDYKQYMI